MSADIEALIQQAAQQYNLPPETFRRQLIAESGLRADAVSPAGARGVAQFMPGTAQAFGIDPMNPAQAVPAAALYMRQNLNRYGGDWNKALAAYNWGPGNVARKGMANMPAATSAYIQKVMGNSPLAPAAPSPSGGAPGVLPSSMPQQPGPVGPDGPAIGPAGPAVTPPPPNPFMSSAPGLSLSDMLAQVIERDRALNRIV